MQKYLLSLDQGTTSSRAILFDLEGTIITSAQFEFTQHYPMPGYVEHDANEILKTELDAVREVLRKANVQKGEVAAIGVTNQRETTIVWEKATGKPVHPAIVWQCRRTAPLCEQLIREGMRDYIAQSTGLLIDAYFSATKLRYILDAVPNGQMLAEAGNLLFGTVDTWLIWNLTGAHVTDYSNASRTMLYNIHTLSYDPVIMRRLNIPACILPEVRPSACVYGYVKDGIDGLEALAGVPISGDAGDQQAALFGQACFEPGQAKCTYGTGGFLMMQTGETPVASKNRLLTTIAWGVGGKVRYALEGSIFNAGSSIKWLRDEVGLISSAHEIDVLAESVPDAGGAYFVSAFTGLGAPHWDMYARGAIVGITRGTRPEHIIRAAQESIAYQSMELVEAMEKDIGAELHELKVDGGASRDAFLMQFQADILNKTVLRPVVRETTALGAAYLAGLATGVWNSQEEIRSLWKCDVQFNPKMSEAKRQAGKRGWAKAVGRSLDWEEHG